MKKLVCSAIALSMTSAAALGSGDDWSTLDQEVEALTSSLSATPQNGGPQMFGRIRMMYVSASDTPAFFVGDDTGDFNVRDARFGVQGSRGDYSYKVQVDFADNDALVLGQFGELLDAYLEFPIGGNVTGRFGQFKAGFARSALVSSGVLAFTDRSGIGALFSDRNEGIQVGGEFDQLTWTVGAQDGTDLDGDDIMITGRVAFDVLGSGKDLAEGAYGGPDAPAATAAIGFYDDGGLSDGDGFILEFHGGTNVYSFGADILDIGDMITVANGTATDGLHGITLVADSTPFSVYGSYMFQPDTWEVALRYQDYDNTFDETKIDLAVNNYLDGHNLKWTLQVSTSESDAAVPGDRDSITLQLQVAF